MHYRSHLKTVIAHSPHDTALFNTAPAGSGVHVRRGLPCRPQAVEGRIGVGAHGCRDDRARNISHEFNEPRHSIHPRAGTAAKAVTLTIKQNMNASFKERHADNVPGKFYVINQCLDCDLCRETAPNNFGRNDQGGYSYVKKQPTTHEEEAACREASEGCCTDAIFADGDKHDWTGVPPYDPAKHLTTKAPETSCCHSSKRPWWRFW